jgi:hypothetical protein
MRKVCGKEGNILGIIHGPKQGKDVLVVGTILNEEYQVIDSSIKNFFDDWSRVEVLPLVGMALPYLDKEVHECFILPPVTQLLDKFGEIIKEEIKRISNKVNFLI